MGTSNFAVKRKGSKMSAPQPNAPATGSGMAAPQFNAPATGSEMAAHQFNAPATGSWMTAHATLKVTKQSVELSGPSWLALVAIGCLTFLGYIWIRNKKYKKGKFNQDYSGQYGTFREG